MEVASNTYKQCSFMIVCVENLGSQELIFKNTASWSHFAHETRILVIRDPG